MDYEAQKHLFSASHKYSPFSSNLLYIYLSGTSVRQSAREVLLISHYLHLMPTVQ